MTTCRRLPPPSASRRVARSRTSYVPATIGGPLRGGVRGRPSARGAVSVSINPLCLWTRSLASECVTGPVVRIWFFDRYTSISYNCRRISPISRPRREGLESMAATVASLCCNSGPSGAGYAMTHHGSNAHGIVADHRADAAWLGSASRRARRVRHSRASAIDCNRRQKFCADRP